MKVVAFNGSPRKDGNTALMINCVFEELQKEGIETELVQIGGKEIRGCKACYTCFEKKNKQCSQKNDMVNECIEKMIASDVIILASPTYFSNVTSEIKALIDRAGLVSMANGQMLKRKIGAGVVAVRRSGAANVFDALNKFFLINQMIIPGSVYWNMAIGREKGAVAEDKEGMNTMKILGENIAWLLKKII